MILIWHCSKGEKNPRVVSRYAKNCPVSTQNIRIETYLLDEVSKEDGLLPQGIVDQAFREEDHPMGEVVLREPGYHTLLLHVRATRDVNDQVSQVLPVSAHAQLS